MIKILNSLSLFVSAQIDPHESKGFFSALSLFLWCQPVSGHFVLPAFALG